MACSGLGKPTLILATQSYLPGGVERHVFPRFHGRADFRDRRSRAAAGIGPFVVPLTIDPISPAIADLRYGESTSLMEKFGPWRLVAPDVEVCNSPPELRQEVAADGIQ